MKNKRNEWIEDKTDLILHSWLVAFSLRINDIPFLFEISENALRSTILRSTSSFDGRLKVGIEDCALCWQKSTIFSVNIECCIQCWPYHSSTFLSTLNALNNVDLKVVVIFCRHKSWFLCRPQQLLRPPDFFLLKDCFLIIFSLSSLFFSISLRK